MPPRGELCSLSLCRTSTCRRLGIASARGASAASSGSERNQDRTTTLDFRHAGSDAQSEFFGANNFAWGQVLQNLKQVVEAPRS